MKMFGVTIPSLYFISALADTCPPVKDITVQCARSSCNYSAETQSAAWKGNNKNPSHKLSAFNFITFRSSEESESDHTLKGKVNYCTYTFPNSRGKQLRLFLDDKSKFWDIKPDETWEDIGHRNYKCRGGSEENVEECQFTPHKV